MCIIYIIVIIITNKSQQKSAKSHIIPPRLHNCHLPSVPNPILFNSS